jgi:hypothetical protein
MAGEPASKVNEIDAGIKRLIKHWTALKRAHQTWDTKTATQSLVAVDGQLQQFATDWDDQKAAIDHEFEQLQQFVTSDDYAQQVETALAQAGIPFKGKFPNYEFSPFKLSFSGETGVIRLAIGRKSEQTKSFAPDEVAKWVNKRYRQVAESRFDPAKLCKELLSAYEYLNKLQTQSTQVQWGSNVLLRDIYRLLTLRQSARQDYPETLFAYDLGRLREQFEIRFEGQRFELVPAREHNLVLINRKGEEERVGSLAIYARSEET